MKRKYVFVLMWYLFIVWGSLTPPNGLPKIYIFPHFDKVVHFGLYFTLTVLLIPIQKIKINYKRNYITAFIISTCTGILFEILQLIATENRSASLADVLANISGAILGIFFYQLFIRNKRLEYLIFRIE